MNQTKKRLKIINLAISITDMETINLQIRQLRPLSSDLKIQEIIAVLEEKTYAQAQALIQTYIETPNEEILQRTALVEKELQDQEEASLIEEFNLFLTPKKQIKNEEELFDLELLQLKEQKEQQAENQTDEAVDFESFLNIEADDVLKRTVSKEEESDLDKFLEGFIPKEVPTPVPTKEPTPPAKPSPSPTQTIAQKSPTLEKKKTEESSPVLKPKAPSSKTSTATPYPAISYIEQKLSNMQKQYPLVEKAQQTFPSVEAWLNKIATEGYSEEEVHEIHQHIEKLISKEQTSEAGLLLLTGGATLSTFAQFMLARALYKGIVIEQNIQESFTHMHTLATNDSYPEAICDLGQFHEYGIGTEKDLKKAELLYAEAMQLGIHRAQKHYEKVKKLNQGFFGFLKK